ncbi:MAG: DUF1565 domain-containing protein, partial [Ferruginibacter sp.]
MKILTTILLILFAVNSQAGNIYIATSGNDGSGNGSIGNPYLTVGKAASVASYGDIIRPANGTYTFAAGVSIPVGVSIEGSDSANVKFVGNYTNTSQSDALLMLISTTDGTNGNQHISGIGFDGNNLTCFQAIIVYGRSNVKVFNVAIRNFVNSGILFRGTYALGREPTIPATGNELHHATIENCADRTTRLVGAGIVATGYAGLLIHDIVSRQGGRPRLHNGNNFGAAGTNTASGLKIYNSKFYRPPSDSSSNLGNSLDNSFILELWDSQGGMEIYNNEFHGGTQAIDLAGNDDKSKGAYTYGYWIHDNYFNSDSLYANLPIPLLVAIDYEGSGENIIIERNHFKNYSYGVMMTLADVSQKGQRNTTIQNNLFENIGTVNVQFNADIFINGGGSPANAGKITGLNIYNNTHSSLARYGLLIVGLKSSNQIVGFNYI